MTGSRSIVRTVVSRWIIMSLAFGALLFLPAGTWRYWQAWTYVGVLFTLMALVMVYFLRHDPALLERRMKMREPEPEQRRLMGFASVVFVAGFVVAGLDHRFGWSEVPLPAVVVSMVVVVLSYGGLVLVFRENSFASRVIEVEQGQRVISTGPYAVVRHPMYVAAAVLYLCTPIALGSYWALVPFVLVGPVLVMRILNEEKVLRRDLEGYPEYCEKVRYRLVPGIW